MNGLAIQRLAPVLAGAAIAVAGCQVIAGIEVRDEQAGSEGGALGSSGAPPIGGGGGAGSAPPPVTIRYCEELPDSGLPLERAPDWSCVRERVNEPNDPGIGDLIISGWFNNYTTIEEFSYCRIPGTDVCSTDAATVASGQEAQFSVTTEQEGYGLVRWTFGSDQVGEATMWHTVTFLDSYYVGETYLMTRDTLASIAALGGLPMDRELGAAFIGIGDCQGKSAEGVRFAAVSGHSEREMGTHFAIVGTFPSDDLTSDAGFGGLVDLEAGYSRIYATVGDGCIVAEARILVEPARTAYVVLVPNGAGDPNLGAGGAGGSKP